MSRQGLKIAIEVGLSRKKFDDRESAENYFTNLKSIILDKVVLLQELHTNEKLDYSPQSLKLIEKLYFYYYDNNKFDEKKITKLKHRRKEENTKRK